MPQCFNDGKFIEWCVYSRSEAFINCGSTNWKDASGNKNVGFAFQERSHFHRHCIGILTRSHNDIVDMMSTEHGKQKAVNHAYLRIVLQNVVFLAKQGLPSEVIGYQQRRKGKHEQR